MGFDAFRLRSKVDVDAARHFEVGRMDGQVFVGGIFDMLATNEPLAFQQRHFGLLKGAGEVKGNRAAARRTVHRRSFCSAVRATRRCRPGQCVKDIKQSSVNFFKDFIGP